MILPNRKIQLETQRLTLRLPRHSDFQRWTALRAQSKDVLVPWEPRWAEDHLSRKNFTNRVYWAAKTNAKGTALPLFLIRRSDDRLIGGITLDNIRRGPAQAGTLGYWTGEPFMREGYMSEAVAAIVHHTFTRLDLSRIEAACLPENAASRGLLEKSGFKYEGVAQSYLQINGRWRSHVLYAALRMDRRGKSDVMYSARKRF